MSVLNQSGDEQVECPLCMEPLEVDDLNFYPCTCGYQICRFCWHRIRTDENGLCPACRKAYSENPADFIPLSKEQVAQLKAEKRQRDQQRKAKLSESRKHLASVRVVQRNLVFVVGLPTRLADAEILKKYEYFGKFGKIHKVVINQSTAYAGTQGPSASAYVTYMKSDDALRAIQHVNNTIMDGKTIKTSLGTTKYCSHFMKNQPCPKPDCMYLHDFGDLEASFTKEQMHAGKHQEYEKKLHDALLSKMAAGSAATTSTAPTTSSTAPSTNGMSMSTSVNLTSSASLAAVTTTMSSSSGSLSTSTAPVPSLDTHKQPTVKQKEATVSAVPTSSAFTATGQGVSKETWPQLNDKLQQEKMKTDKTEKERSKSKKKNGSSADSKKTDKKGSAAITEQHRQSSREKLNEDQSSGTSLASIDFDRPNSTDSKSPPMPATTPVSVADGNSVHKLSLLDDNSSFFSQNTFSKIPPDSTGDVAESDSLLVLPPHIEPLVDIETDCWDFGFTKHSNHLEELSKQRISVKQDSMDKHRYSSSYLDSFSKLDSTPSPFGQMNPYNTENLLETLAKNGVSYSQNVQQQVPVPPPAPSDGHYVNHHLKEPNGLDQHMSKFFTDFCRNGLTQQQQQLQQQQVSLFARDGLALGLNGLSQPQHPPNGYNQHLKHIADQQQQALLLLQQQRHIEEQLMSLGISNKSHLPHFGQMNGSPYDLGPSPLQNGSSSFGTSQLYGNGAMSSATTEGNVKSREVLDDKVLDYSFQEAQKALEKLVESDSHMHNTGRTNLGSSQINGIVHSQSGAHLPPPPPGFVQPHMNSFGSKILPYLNMNSQQQQMNTTQNSWPTSLSQPLQQQQNQQLKGMGATCNDWKVLDPAILSSRRHIPNMQLLDQYSSGQTVTNGSLPQQQQQQPQPPRPFDTFNGFSNFNPLQQSYNNYSHLAATQQNLNWLGSEINTQISSPPGFRTPGQTTKQQEC